MHGADGNAFTVRDPAVSETASTVHLPGAAEMPENASTVDDRDAAENTSTGRVPSAGENAPASTGLVHVAPCACWALYSVQIIEAL